MPSMMEIEWTSICFVFNFLSFVYFGHFSYLTSINNYLTIELNEWSQFSLKWIKSIFAKIQTLNWIALGIDHGYETLQHYNEEQNLESDNLCCEKLALSDFWRETNSCCWVLCVWPRRYAAAYAPQHPSAGSGLTWRKQKKDKGQDKHNIPILSWLLLTKAYSTIPVTLYATQHLLAGHGLTKTMEYFICHFLFLSD